MKEIKIKDIAEYLECRVQTLYHTKKTNYKKYELLALGFKAKCLEDKKVGNCDNSLHHSNKTDT